MNAYTVGQHVAIGPRTGTIVAVVDGKGYVTWVSVHMDDWNEILTVQVREIRPA